MSTKPEISSLQLEIAESNEDEAHRIRLRAIRFLRLAKHYDEAGMPQQAAKARADAHEDRIEASRLTREARRIRAGKIEIRITGLRF